MSTVVNIHQAKTELSKLLARAAAGEDIVIAKAGKPIARLVGLRPRKTARVLGNASGQVWIAADFDAPLPDDVSRGFQGDA
jgi:prevent-host-death family protein